MNRVKLGNFANLRSNAINLLQISSREITAEAIARKKGAGITYSYYKSEISINCHKGRKREARDVRDTLRFNRVESARSAAV